jgi:two-component system nitrogen regulation sensor histidine kinase NtrY
MTAPEGTLALLGVGAAVTLATWGWQRARYRRRLQTFAAVLASFREGDFSVRARKEAHDSLSEEMLRELNALGDTLRAQRLGALEAWTLLQKVMAEIDAVVLAFDEAGHIRLANEAAARALGRPIHDLVSRPADAFGLSELLTGETPRVARGVGALGAGALELRRGTFRLVGQVHTLVVLSDMSRALREQERNAWKRLIVVMGHEINNSLAPIESIAENLQALVARDTRDDDWLDDVKSGLAVVGRRASGLGRFMAAYSRLARLPPPTLAEMDVGAWVTRVAKLEQRMGVRVEAGPEVVVRGDSDQLDQLLINLVKNAVDATLERAEAGGEVVLGWSTRSENGENGGSGARVEVSVRDRGPGLGETANLFVPFFTTKPGGSGIGLALAREIAEAHRGGVSLEGRKDGPGACATVWLPVARPAKTRA